MKAILVKGSGGPECLAVEKVDTPQPDRGEIRVKVECTAVNRADIIQRKGNYPAPGGVPADILGLEYAGVVDALSADVEGFQTGDRVFGLVAGGSYAEYLIVHHRTVAKIPDNLSFEQAAAVPEAYTTAYDAMVCQGELSAGDCVLISAVGSGVGTAALQIARAIGATSIGLSRTGEKITKAIELGLDHGIVVKDGEFCRQVLELTDGRGVDLVLELLGGNYVLQDLECTCLNGRIILVGLLAGAKVDFNLAQLLRKRITIKGTTLRARPLEEKIEAGSLLAKRIAPLLASGRLDPVVDRTFSLWDAAEAHRYIESNESFGKVILRVDR